MTNSFEVNTIDTGIIRFLWHEITRQAVDAWEAYVREHNGLLREPVRVLYDMRAVDYPTPYFVNRVSIVFEEISIPDDTRTGIVVREHHHVVHYLSLAKRIGFMGGEVHVFQSYHDVIGWLTRE
jgi:hypothetical protein